MHLGQDILGKTHCTSGLAFNISFWNIWMELPPFCFFHGGWGAHCAPFSSWTNRWSIWSTYSFSLRVFTLFLFYLFSLSLLLHRLCSACWSLSRQNLTFKGTWWKLNHLSELVLYLFFLCTDLFLTACLFRSAVCGILISVATKLITCTFPVYPMPWLKPIKAKCLQHYEKCAF